MLTVWSSTFWMSSTPSSCPLYGAGLFGTFGTRLKLNTTSSAVNGEPSWKVTPRRRLKRHVFPPSELQDVARSGSMCPCAEIDQRAVDVLLVRDVRILQHKMRVDHRRVLGPDPQVRRGSDLGRERQQQREDGACLFCHRSGRHGVIAPFIRRSGQHGEYGFP